MSTNTTAVTDFDRIQERIMTVLMKKDNCDRLAAQSRAGEMAMNLTLEGFSHEWLSQPGRSYEDARSVAFRVFGEPDTEFQTLLSEAYGFELPTL